MYKGTHSGLGSGIILAENTGSGHSYRMTIDPQALAKTFADIVTNTETALEAEKARKEAGEPKYTADDLAAADLVAQLPTEGAGKSGSGDVVLADWNKAGSKSEGTTVNIGKAAIAEYIQQLGDYLISQGYDEATVNATVTTMTNYYTALLNQVDDNDNRLHKKGEGNSVSTTYVDAFGNEQKLYSSYTHIARADAVLMYKGTKDGRDSGVILAENTGFNHGYRLTVDPNALVNKFIENFKFNEVALNNGVDGVVDGQVNRAEKMGDGALITALTALGNTEAGAQIIKEAITTNPDGSVTVTFKGRGPVTVTVEEIQKYDTDNDKTDMYSNGDNDYLVVEIAMNKLSGIDLTKGIDIDVVFELLTGERTHTTKNPEEFLAQLDKRGLEDTVAYVILDANLAYDAITTDGERWSYESPDRGQNAHNTLAISNITDETVTIRDTYNEPVREITISREQFEKWDIVEAGYIDLPDVKVPVEPEVVPEVDETPVTPGADETQSAGGADSTSSAGGVTQTPSTPVTPGADETQSAGGADSTSSAGGVTPTPEVNVEPEVVPQEPAGPNIKDVNWADLLAKFPIEGAGNAGSGDIVLTGYNKAKSKSAEGTVDQAQKNLEMYIEEIGEYLIEQGFDKETVDAAVKTLTNYYNALMDQVNDNDNGIHRKGEKNNVSATYVDAFGNEQKLDSSYNHVARDLASLMYKGTKDGLDSGVILAENTGSNHSYRVTIDPNTLLNKFVATFEATEKAMNEPEVKKEAETPVAPGADETQSAGGADETSSAGGVTPTPSAPEQEVPSKTETKQTLAEAMKDMYLRDTYCAGVYCPVMPDANGNREHYIWDEANGKMVSVGTYKHIDGDGSQLKGNANYQAYLQGYNFTATDGVYEKDGKNYEFKNGQFVEIGADETQSAGGADETSSAGGATQTPVTPQNPTNPVKPDLGTPTLGTPIQINPDWNIGINPIGGINRPIAGINPPKVDINPLPIGDLPKINIPDWQIKQYTDFNDKI